MSGTQLFGTLLPLVAGAAIGFVPTYLVERRKERTVMLTRWDASLFTLSSELAESARHLLHLAQHVYGDGERIAPDERVVLLQDIDRAHARLRTLAAQIPLLAGRDVQLQARLVVHHAFAVRLVLVEREPDPRATTYPGTDPVGRFNAALAGFYVAVRRQLNVRDPEQVAPLQVGVQVGGGVASAGPEATQ
jgi:hypothetical protein